MFIFVIGEPHIQPITTDHGNSLVVETFTYLGSILTCDDCLDAEIHQPIQKVSVAYGMLEKQVWTNSNITWKTKVLHVERSSMHI